MGKDWPSAGPSPLGNPLQCLERHEWSEAYRDGFRPCVTAATIRHRTSQSSDMLTPLKNWILHTAVSLMFSTSLCGVSARTERAACGCKREAIKDKREASKNRMETRPRLMRRRGAWLTLAALFHPFRARTCLLACRGMASPSLVEQCFR